MRNHADSDYSDDDHSDDDHSDDDHSDDDHSDDNHSDDDHSSSQTHLTLIPFLEMRLIPGAILGLKPSTVSNLIFLIS